MVVGYMRVSKADGGRVTDLSRDALLAAPGGRGGAADGPPCPAGAVAGVVADGGVAGAADRPARPDRGGDATAGRGHGGLPAGELGLLPECGRGGGDAVGADGGAAGLSASGRWPEGEVPL